MRAAGFSRRAVLAASLALMAAPARGDAPRRVVAFDWGMVETLLGLGVVPIGVAEPEGYRAWVGEPVLPPAVADVGLRLEPNLEALARLRPDLIVLTPQLAALEPALQRIAPTLNLAVFTPEGDVWDNATRVVRALAQATGRPEAGDALVADATAALETARPAVQALTGRPLYVASFVDGRHVRVYGRGSVFDAVLRRLDVKNAFTGPTSFWGFATFGLEHLAAAPDAALLLFEPVPSAARETMEEGPLWRRLPMVAAGRVHLLPPVWSFGGLVSALRFTRLLAAQAGTLGKEGGAVRG